MRPYSFLSCCRVRKLENRNNLLLYPTGRLTPAGFDFVTFRLYEVEKTRMGNFFVGRLFSNSWLEKKIVRDRSVQNVLALKNPPFGGTT
jgi:hypothetical protein